MSARKVEASASRTDRVIEKLRRGPSEPPGVHLQALPEETVVHYIMEALPTEEVERIDAHLESCPDCNEEMLWLLDDPAVWQGSEAEAQLAAVRERVEKALSARAQMEAGAAQAGAAAPRYQPAAETGVWERAKQAVREILLGCCANVAPQVAFKGRTVHRGQAETPHGILRWRWEEDDQGNLVFIFASHGTDLRDRRLVLRAEGFEREVILERVAPDQVGTDPVTIEREKRAQWPPEMELAIYLVADRPATAERPYAE